MSHYKNFSAYNNEAENIRPTARIQLIQRILNAASLISSLAAGVPLKWASAYKSFQVLKYQENQDPTDVTSEEAISAVDSILHEAESQLRASQDDMNTLKTELTNLPISGITNWAAGPKLIPNVYYRIIQAGGTNNLGYSICFLTDDEGDFASSFKIMTNATYDSLRYDQKKDINDNALLPLIIQSDSSFGDPNNSLFVFARLAAPDTNIIYDVGAFKFYNVASQKCSLQITMTEHYYAEDTGAFVSRHPKRYTFADLSSYAWPSGNLIKTELLSDVTDTVELGGVYARNVLPISGKAAVDESLGLPDPSGLISILDNMTN